MTGTDSPQPPSRVMNPGRWAGVTQQLCSGGELTDPPLGGPALCQDRVDHLERHDLRQLAPVARGEDTVGYRDLAGDDTLTRQRSLLGTSGVPMERSFHRAVSAVRGSPPVPHRAGSPPAAAPAAGPG
jgi:hypothetical protein